MSVLHRVHEDGRRAASRANFELREIFVPMSGPMLEAQAVGIDMTRDPAIGAAAMLRRANG